MKLHRRPSNSPGKGPRPNLKLLFGLIAALFILIFLVPPRSNSPKPAAPTKDFTVKLPPLWYDLGLSWAYILFGVVLIGVIVAVLLLAHKHRDNR